MRSFYPWIAFAALSSVSWLCSAIVGFLVAVALILRARGSRTAWDALILEASSTGFFLIVSAVALTSPNSTLRHYSGAGSLAWLALVAWITLAARKPLTLGIARQSTPAELWHQPRFLQVNMIITTVWATSFTLTAIVTALVYAATTNSGIATIMQVIGFVIPVVFTIRYSAHVRASAAAEMSRPA